jgi:hypothetical protein
MRFAEVRLARSVATFLAAVALALLAVGNGAAAGPPDGSSAINQYVEMVPTDEGGAAPSNAGTAPAVKAKAPATKPAAPATKPAAPATKPAAPATKPAVTPRAVHRLKRKIDKQGGASAGDLTAVALSPVYGAPQRSLSLGSTPKRLLLPNDRVSPLTASVSAVVASPSLLALLLAMVGLTAAIGFASFRRHRLEADAYSLWLRALRPHGKPPRADG